MLNHLLGKLSLTDLNITVYIPLSSMIVVLFLLLTQSIVEPS
ncbi:hypothetical protein ACNARK_05960 [Proteus sp. DFP240708]